jgi:hypothetical protein
MHSLKDSIRGAAYGTPVGRALVILPRVVKAVRIRGQPLLYVLPWASASREYANISYEIDGCQPLLVFVAW